MAGMYDYFEGAKDFGNEAQELPPQAQTDMLNATTIDQLENFEASESDPEQVAGDPEGSMEYWEYQGSTNRCAVYSQKFIIEQLTGEEIDIDEIVEVATENGWFSEDGGTSILNLNKLIEYYGVDSDISQYNSIEDIEECLENGGLVEVAIDADEIWYGENDDFYVPNDGANHAVEVIGVDRTDPENPVVILNDSGNPNGCGVEIPLDTFIDAWEDSDFTMVTAMG